MKKMLKFTFDTMVNSLQYLAYSSGILLADSNENIYQWLICHYLRIYYNGSNLCTYLPGEGPAFFNELKDCKEDCFERFQMKLPIIFAEFNSEELIFMIQKMIDYEFYCYGFYNEYYIDNRKAYLNFNFIHDYLIIGYNDFDKVFYVAGYTKEHIYQAIPVSYKCFINAVRYNEECNNCITIDFYKINKEFDFRYDTDIVNRSICEFNNSTDYSVYYDKNYLYGKEALIYFEKECSNTDNDRYLLNIKSFSDYINCFVSFIQYQKELNKVTDEILFQKILENHKNMNTLVNMTIKFFLKKDISTLKKIKVIVNETINNIIQFMYELGN